MHFSVSIYSMLSDYALYCTYVPSLGRFSQEAKCWSFQNYKIYVKFLFSNAPFYSLSDDLHFLFPSFHLFMLFRLLLSKNERTRFVKHGIVLSLFSLSTMYFISFIFLYLDILFCAYYFVFYTLHEYVRTFYVTACDSVLCITYGYVIAIRQWRHALRNDVVIDFSLLPWFRFWNLPTFQ